MCGEAPTLSIWDLSSVSCGGGRAVRDLSSINCGGGRAVRDLSRAVRDLSSTSVRT